MQQTIVGESLPNNVLFRMLFVRGQLGDLMPGTAHIMKYTRRIACSKTGARAPAKHDTFRRNY
jgi:hypothetical protein